jgi:hypothetical protein
MPRNLPITDTDVKHLVDGLDDIDKARSALAAYDWLAYFRLLSKSERLIRFSILERYLTDVEYFAVLGWVWVNGEKYNLEQPAIIGLFSAAARDVAERCKMMKADELQTFSALTEPVTVFRGAEDEESLAGWSWSLSEEVARKFTYGDGFVREGRCHVADVIAFKHGPEDESEPEDEIIINPDTVFNFTDREVVSEE